MRSDTLTMYSDLALCSEPPLGQMARFRFSTLPPVSGRASTGSRFVRIRGTNSDRVNWWPPTHTCGPGVLRILNRRTQQATLNAAQIDVRDSARLKGALSRSKCGGLVIGWVANSGMMCRTIYDNPHTFLTSLSALFSTFLIGKGW